jgi:UDP:flavonoid glycosyltransferase YjiC (YdhE family)
MFVTWAWPSHFYPLVPLAWAFQAAGHEVRVASQPALTETIVRAGLTAVPVGQDVDMLAIAQPFYQWVADQKRPVEWAHLREKGPLTVRMYVIMARSMVDDTIAFGRAWRPGLIVYEPTSYAGPLAAAVLGIPAIRHAYGVDFPCQAREFEDEALAGLCCRLGLDSVEPLGLATVDPCPPSMQVASSVARIPMRYVPYNGPAVFPEWLSRPPARRRICVTWGTSSSVLTGGRMFLPPRVIEAAGDLDIEIVASMTARDAASLGAVPPNVRVVEALALHLLLPSCDAVVHQGGNGTLLTAALCGVPQLALPQLPDQMFYTAKLAESGAGAVLRMDQIADEVLARRLADILNEPGYAAAARRVRAEILGQPSAAQTVPAVADLVAGR